MLPEEVKKLIGTNRGIRVFEVEKGAIRKFADAVDDRNPLYWDDEYAKNSKYGAVIAPPGFFGWPTKWEEDRTFPPTFEEDAEPRGSLLKAGYGRQLDGGMDYEFYIPVRAGDTIVVSSTIRDIIERDGKTGKLFFIITETTYTNQNGDLVAKSRSTTINR
ncbi:MAG: MaoC family dehydratase N-terminal domain-containing protein [Chloroflexi bacterium]|nr:MaoC family dehydratase N-terminal domain-containing protein [Chloroflexota bacterium]